VQKVLVSFVLIYSICCRSELDSFSLFFSWFSDLLLVVVQFSELEGMIMMMMMMMKDNYREKSLDKRKKWRLVGVSLREIDKWSLIMTEDRWVKIG
jgi:hypothetical protein